MTIGLTSQITEPLRCPDCRTEMDFLKSEFLESVFVSTIVERRYFLCPNCQLLSMKSR
jgi:uncharacterized protein with PIN domain